jgi:hypothetical protein
MESRSAQVGSALVGVAAAQAAALSACIALVSAPPPALAAEDAAALVGALGNGDARVARAAAAALRAVVEASAANCGAVLGAGGDTALLALLAPPTAPAPDDTCVVLASLAALVAHGGGAETSGSTAIVAAAVGAMERYADVPDVAARGSALLAALPREHGLDVLPVVGPLVAALTTHVASADVATHGCRALELLCRALADVDVWTEEELACNEELLNGPVPEAVVAVLAHHAADAVVVRAGCAALKALTARSFDPDDRLAGRQAGGTEALTAVLAGPHGGDAALAACCCEALGDFARAVELDDGDSGAEQAAILGALERHVDDETVVLAACFSLEELSRGTEAVAARFAAAVLGAMQRHLVSERVVEQACGALSQWRHVAWDAVRKAGGVAALVSVLRRHRPCAAIVVHACRMLAQMGAGGAALAEAVDLALLEHSAATAEPRKDAVAEAGVALLVAAEDECSEEALKALKRHLASRTVAELVCERVAGCIGGTDLDDGSAWVGTAAVGAVVGALAQHSGASARVAEHGCAVLQHARAAAADAAAALPVVQALLVQYAAAPAVVARACGALGALASVHPQAGEAAATAVSDAMRRFPAEEAVTECCLYACAEMPAQALGTGVVSAVPLVAVALLASPHRRATAVEHACRALANFMRVEALGGGVARAVRGRLLSTGCVQAIVSAARKYAKLNSVAAACYDALAAATTGTATSSLSRCADAVVEAGGARLLVEVLQAVNSDVSTRVTAAAAAALVGVTRVRAGVKAVVVASGVEAMLSALSQLKGSRGAALSLLSALANVAGTRRGKAAVLATGGAGAIVALLPDLDHRIDEEPSGCAVRVALTTLIALTDTAAGAEAVLLAGGAAAAVRVLAAHPMNGEACALLAALARAGSAGKAAAVVTGGAAALAAQAAAAPGAARTLRSELLAMEEAGAALAAARRRCT